MNFHLAAFIVLSCSVAIVAPATRHVLRGTRVVKSPGSSECPENYKSIGDGCYYISDTTASSWYQAVKHCYDINGYIASISTEEENTALKGYLATLPDLESINGWWLGGSDEAIEGEWRWKSNLKKICFTDWCHGEPNNYGHENCLAYNPECDFQWNDRACNYQHFRYICEPYL